MEPFSLTLAFTQQFFYWCFSMIFDPIHANGSFLYPYLIPSPQPGVSVKFLMVGETNSNGRRPFNSGGGLGAL